VYDSAWPPTTRPLPRCHGHGLAPSLRAACCRPGRPGPRGTGSAKVTQPRRRRRSRWRSAPVTGPGRTGRPAPAGTPFSVTGPDFCWKTGRKRCHAPGRDAGAQRLSHDSRSRPGGPRRAAGARSPYGKISSTGMVNTCPSPGQCLRRQQFLGQCLLRVCQAGPRPMRPASKSTMAKMALHNTKTILYNKQQYRIKGPHNIVQISGSTLYCFIFITYRIHLKSPLFYCGVFQVHNAINTYKG
jgi:hypothetical protein